VLIFEREMKISHVRISIEILKATSAVVVR